MEVLIAGTLGGRDRGIYTVDKKDGKIREVRMER